MSNIRISDAGGGLTAHALNGAFHTGLLDISQIKGYDSGTKFWIDCLPNVFGSKGALSYVNNAAATGTIYMACWVPLPITVGDKSLKVYQVRVCLRDADNNNYVDYMYLISGQSDGTYVTDDSEAVDYDSAGEHTWDCDDELYNVGADRSVWVQLRCQILVTTDLDIGSVQVQVAYV